MAKLDPYLYAGIGRYLGNESQSLVPIGGGVEYHLNDNFGVFLEVAGRWILSNRKTPRTSLAFGFHPSLGLSFDIGRIPRPQPPRMPPPIVQADTEDTEPVATTEVTDNIPQEPAEQGEPGYILVPPSEFGGMVPAEFAEPDTIQLEIRNNMVRVPDGTFILGLTDEDPLQLQTAGLRRITVSGFFIDQYEVSNAKYREYLSTLPQESRSAMMPDTTVWSETGNRFSWSEYFRGDAYADYPVVAVTFDQARQFCEAHGKRLPTEAEWEYAGRAGRLGGVYPWPGLETRDANGRFLANYNPGRGGYAADGFAFTAPAAAYPPSQWGLYNMSGNVAEWTQDTYHPSYTNLSDFNPLHTDPQENRHVVRGGSWASDGFYIGVGVRDAYAADEVSPYIGFRCVMDISSVNGN